MLTARYRHDENSEVVESNFPDDVWKSGFSNLVGLIDSRQGGWCEVVNEAGEVLRHHPDKVRALHRLQQNSEQVIDPELEAEYAKKREENAVKKTAKRLQKFKPLEGDPLKKAVVPKAKTVQEGR